MRPRRVAALLVLLAAVGVVVGLVISVDSPSKPSNANGSTASGATTVQRRDLVETDTESGTLSYANPQTVYNRLSGTITWLASIGQLIKPGEALFRVDGRPVILMNGTMPAYRDLAPGDSDGQDILQLNRNLVDLGFNPDGIVVDDVWQAATTAGVDELQAALGETETGKLTLGQAVFLPGDQLVSTVDATLGGGSSGSGPSSPSTSNSPRSSNTPRSSNSGSPSNGSGGGTSPTPILQTTSTQRVVTVDLDPSKQSEAKIGKRVTVVLPGGDTVNGKITAVSPVAQQANGNSANNGSGGQGNGNNGSGGSGSTIPVTITLSGHRTGAGLDHAAVSVNFAQAVANHVLSVPVTALLATGGGSYAVQEAGAPHNLIPVTTGLFAAGYVQISGAGIYPGLDVTDAQA
jgi:hypothetical protein